MAAMIQTRSRQETPERWHRAFARALRNGLEVFCIAGTGEYVVTSATKLDTVYRTNGVDCECEAAVLYGDPVCQHRAVVRDLLGWLPQPSPESPAVAQSATQKCPSCMGGKVEEWGVSGPIGWTYCEICGGSGVKPAPRPFALPRPALLPVAA